MPEKDKFFSVNIREYLTLGNDEEAGEPALVELSCFPVFPARRTRMLSDF